MPKPDFNSFRQLAGSNLLHKDFCDQLLLRTLNITNAQGGLIWNCNESPFQIITQHSLGQATRLPITPDDHANLLAKVAEQDKSLFVRPADDDKSAVHDAPLILICPIHRQINGNVETELLELLLKPLESTELETEALETAKTVCEIAATYRHPENGDAAEIQSSAPRQDVEPPVSSLIELSFERTGEYLNALHQSIDRKMACSNIANETRRFLECDRVTVACRHHGKFRLMAISGQTSVNRRSNTTKLLEKLTRRILATGQPFWYPDQGEVPPQISELLDDYLAISAVRSLIVEPVFEKAISSIEDPESHERKGNPIIGGIVYEHCNEQWTRDSVDSAIRFTARHSGNTLRNANKHQGLFLYPVWNLLGKSRILTAPRILPKTLLALAAATLVGLILVFWQTDFYIVGDGIIVPKETRKVFSQVDGIVSQINVEHGDSVEADQVLVCLANEDLKLRLQEASGRLDNLRKRLANVRDDRFETRNADRNNPQAAEENIKSLEAQITSLENQITILNLIAAKTIVSSPIDGEVITWDLDQRLLNRPVRNGDLLLEVADTKGPWKLELQLEDRRIGHLMRALNESESSRLPITFLLAADPSKRLKGEVTEIGMATELGTDNEQLLKIQVEIDTASLPVKHARTGVTAQIVCGRSSVGYLWMHDVKEFMQKYVFFRLATK